MSKKNLLILVLLMFVGSIYYFIGNTDNQRSTEELEGDVLGEPSDKVAHDTLAFEDNEYEVVWYKPSSQEKISLFLNLDTKETSRDIADTGQCNFFSSAGFYSTEEKPIGLFIEEGTKISEWQKNSIINGIFSVNYMDTPRITREIPKDDLRLAVQAGPLLFENAQKQNLNLASDKKARRIALIITGENEPIFLAFYQKDSVFNGPLLSSLSSLVELFAKKHSIALADAINLDGGTASVFFSEETKLTEISPVGSFLCVK